MHGEEGAAEPPHGGGYKLRRPRHPPLDDSLLPCHSPVLLVCADDDKALV
jgi:hypothetical protein